MLAAVLRSPLLSIFTLVVIFLDRCRRSLLTTKTIKSEDQRLLEINLKQDRLFTTIKAHNGRQTALSAEYLGLSSAWYRQPDLRANLHCPKLSGDGDDRDHGWLQDRRETGVEYTQP